MNLHATLSGTFFIATVCYDRQAPTGGSERAKEQYAIKASSFTEAEALVIQHLRQYAVEVRSIARAPFTTVFVPNVVSDIFYKVKTNALTFDERTGKEKKNPIIYLTNATSTANAESLVRDALALAMQDFIIESVAETKITDIITPTNE